VANSATDTFAAGLGKLRHNAPSEGDGALRRTVGLPGNCSRLSWHSFGVAALIASMVLTGPLSKPFRAQDQRPTFGPRCKLGTSRHQVQRLHPSSSGPELRGPACRPTSRAVRAMSRPNRFAIPVRTKSNSLFSQTLAALSVLEDGRTRID